MVVIVFIIRHHVFHRDVGDDVDAIYSLHGGTGLDTAFPCSDTVLVKTHNNSFVIGCSAFLFSVLELTKPQGQKCSDHDNYNYIMST